MWSKPKTDWSSTDAFTLSDYDRIRSNITAACELVVRLYPSVPLLPMRTYAMTELPDLAFFDNIGQNLERVYKGSFARASYSVKKSEENGSVWDWRELNKIESILLQLWNDLHTQQENKLQLAMMMGGGAFATLI